MSIEPKPTSVLDIGFGYGKYGFLLREYLTFWGHRYYKINDQIIIDGIEIFPGFISELQRLIYSHIIVENAIDSLKQVGHRKYDLILLIDVLEHFTFEDGEKIIEECKRVGKVTIVSTPIEMEFQENAFGNPNERHLSCWDRNKLSNLEAVYITICHDQNWIAVYSDDPHFKIMIDRYSKNHSRLRDIGKLLFPYSFRKWVGQRLEIS